MKSLPFVLLLFLGLFIACNSDNSENNTTTTSADSTQTIADTISTTKEPIKASQNNEFETVDHSIFSSQLAKESQSISPKAIIKLYYPAVIKEGDSSNEKIDIDSKTEGDKTIVTLVHENQPHASIQGLKIVMTLSKKGGKWEVLSIQRQCKCWFRPRGDNSWGTIPCPLK